MSRRNNSLTAFLEMVADEEAKGHDTMTEHKSLALARLAALVRIARFRGRVMMPETLDDAVAFPGCFNAAWSDAIHAAVRARVSLENELNPVDALMVACNHLRDVVSLLFDTDREADIADGDEIEEARSRLLNICLGMMRRRAFKAGATEADIDAMGRILGDRNRVLWLPDNAAELEKQAQAWEVRS